MPAIFQAVTLEVQCVLFWKSESSRTLICWLASIKADWDSRLKREKEPSKSLIPMDSKINCPYVAFPSSPSGFMFVFLQLPVSGQVKLRYLESLNHVKKNEKNQTTDCWSERLVMPYESTIIQTKTMIDLNWQIYMCRVNEGKQFGCIQNNA